MNIIFYFFLVITIMNLPTSASTKITYSPFFEDIDKAKKLPLVSNFPKDEIIRKDNVAVTLGFKLPHAYLVFEYKNGSEVNTRGLHFGGHDYCLGYVNGGIELCAQNTTQIIEEDLNLVLTKFYRAKEKTRIERGLGVIASESEKEVGPSYQKFRSFLTKRDKVNDFFGKIQKIKDSISFSMMGDLFYSNSHNCCTFASLVLREVGINIKLSGWFRGPENLKYYIIEYEKIPEDKRVKSKSH